MTAQDSDHRTEHSSSGTERSGEWNILTVSRKFAGPLYSVDVKDGDAYAVDQIFIAGARVGLDKEIELECQSFDIVREDDNGRLTLIVEPTARTLRTESDQS